MNQLARTDGALAPLAISDEEFKQAVGTIVKGTQGVVVDKQDVLFALGWADSLGLNLLAKEAYAWKDKKGMTLYVSAHGYRVMAERHSKVENIIGPTFFHKEKEEWFTEDDYPDDGPPDRARIYVVRSDRDDPILGVARWSEFGANKVATAKSKGYDSPWIDQPFLMLHYKAIRKGFSAAVPVMEKAGELAQQYDIDGEFTVADADDAPQIEQSPEDELGLNSDTNPNREPPKEEPPKDLFGEVDTTHKKRFDNFKKTAERKNKPTEVMDYAKEVAHLVNQMPDEMKAEMNTVFEARIKELQE